MRALGAKPRDWWIWLAKAGAAHAMARALLLIALVLLNPFGIVDWGERRTRELWQEIYADHYGPPLPSATAPPPVRGRDDITLILLDAEDRKLLNRADIPDSYDLFDMIDRVYRAARQGQGDGWQPRAIFVDMQFSAGAPHKASADALLNWSKQQQEDCDLKPKADSPFRCALIQIARITGYAQWRDQPECQRSTVAKLVCIRRHGGTPLLFAEPFTTDPAGPPVSEGAKALDRVAVLVPAGFQIGRSDLAFPARAEDRENEPYRLSPAAALYAVWRGGPLTTMKADRGGSSDCTPNGPILCPSVETDGTWRSRYWGWSTDFDRPAETVWGIGRADWFTNARESLTGGTLAKGCRVASPDGAGLALSFVRAFASGFNADRLPPCLYTHVLNYRHLGDATGPLLHRAIADRLVLIGYADPEGNDYVPAGPHGDLPGVFHHAMTLDNLILYGADYPKAPEPLVAFLDVTDSDLFNLGALLLILFPTALVTVWAEARNRRLAPGALPTLREWGWRLAAALLTVGFAVSVVLILTGQLAVLPPHYRAASLTIVVFLELLIILLILLRPIRDLLVAKVSVLRILFGETPPEPAALPAGTGHGVGDGDADDAADDGRAGG